MLSHGSSHPLTWATSAASSRSALPPAAEEASRLTLAPQRQALNRSQMWSISSCTMAPEEQRDCGKITQDDRKSPSHVYGVFSSQTFRYFHHLTQNKDRRVLMDREILLMSISSSFTGCLQAAYRGWPSSVWAGSSSSGPTRRPAARCYSGTAPELPERTW